MAWKTNRPPPSSVKPLLKGVLATFILTLVLTSTYMYRDTISTKASRIKFTDGAATDYFKYPFNASDPDADPIDWLIHDARTKQAAILQKRSRTLHSAAQRYRERRGRHPPPGFQEWFHHAMETDAIVVEEFFDRIHDDIRPFWALDAKTITKQANAGEHVVRVRNGTATGDGNTEGKEPWLELWTALVSEFAKHLPDVDMPINHMQEPRILVPWEDMEKYVAKEGKIRKMPTKNKATAGFQSLTSVDAARGQPYSKGWTSGDRRKYWDLVRAACPSDSPARNVPAATDLSLPPTLPYLWTAPFARQGYVQNFSRSMDPCVQPHLRSLHGTFVEPLNVNTTKDLVPLFGGSKLRVNSDMLIPGAMYLSDDPSYTGGDTHGPAWPEKLDRLVWRGVGSGGLAQSDNWMHFHRQRLVEMLNGTTVRGMEANDVRAMTFDMPPLERYNTTRRRERRLGEFLTEFADVGFTHLLCGPSHDRRKECEWLAPHLSAVNATPMAEQFSSKFLPDADGYSFSGRFRAFLLSTSVPLKATVYAEWHDDRLTPWLHFVPLDNTFQDLYGVLDFFTDGDDEPGGSWGVDKVLGKRSKGDDAARWIAEQGKEWAEKVLRREDMRLYVWRLLLEFARVCDEYRDTLGYVDDLP
ncbi:capsular associated protein [Colletotrichum higginsianum]|uniref:Capsular associated protein n=2 Tax=Colletotrichum higginsianum TaxID=80884 RepID=H1V3N8_COLHI|nr:Capsular associated protein [Colletotrichum higginsianum IMI 349063]OBR07561.1 Capsular associated protein [Colletotrichum higginsianum IMI 349063]TIC92693.1 Beta-1,2-xylosyltransferase 1 [Colletotrichum higginsianum]CCF34840.1 capsular associated protein [Colletotrichum higginsianum]